MTSKDEKAVDNAELIAKLVEAGYGKYVDVFLTEERKLYTRKGDGRLNKSAASRLLGMNVRQVDCLLAEMKSVISTSA